MLFFSGIRFLGKTARQNMAICLLRKAWHLKHSLWSSSSPRHMLFISESLGTQAAFCKNPKPVAFYRTWSSAQRKVQRSNIATYSKSKHFIFFWATEHPHSFPLSLTLFLRLLRAASSTTTATAPSSIYTNTFFTLRRGKYYETQPASLSTSLLSEHRQWQHSVSCRSASLFCWTFLVSESV